MTYLPHLEKASSAARNVGEPLAGAIDMIGTLRGAFMNSGGGSEVTMESAIRHAERARYWIGTVIEELRAAQKDMPEPVSCRPSTDAQREDVAAGVAELVSFAAEGGPKRGPRLVSSNAPPPRHIPITTPEHPDQPPAA